MVEDEKNQIKNQAKEIMDGFMEKLGSIDIKGEFNLTRETCFREESEGENGDLGFISRFLANAPKVSENCIVANKKDWE